MHIRGLPGATIARIDALVYARLHHALDGALEAAADVDHPVQDTVARGVFDADAHLLKLNVDPLRTARFVH